MGSTTDSAEASGAPVENAGVAPDVEVEPARVEPAQEPDPQLAAAIAAIVQQLDRRP